MLKAYFTKERICNYICALLTLCLLICQFIPFWNYGSDSLSINGYVWLDSANTEIASYFTQELGSAPNLNSIAAVAATTLLFGVIGIALCLIKSGSAFPALVPSIAALCSLCGFIFLPCFRLGSTWILQIVLAILIIVSCVLAIVFGHRDYEEEILGKKVFTEGDIKMRVAAIKKLGNFDAKNSSTENDANFYRLITFLTDDIPECRIAAVETLGKTSQDIAFTHISHLLNYEKDERVAKAMREALISIRKNMRAEHLKMQ